jgi:hypothetical protein
MKRFHLKQIRYEPETGYSDYDKICEYDTIAECILEAKKIAETDEFMKGYEFDMVSWNFSVTEYRNELIEGHKVPMIYASASMEAILLENCENLDKFVR